MIPRNAANATGILFFFNALSTTMKPYGFKAHISEMNQKDPHTSSWTITVRVLPRHRRVEAYGVFTLELDSLSSSGNDTLIADSTVEFFDLDDKPAALEDGCEDEALTALHEGLVTAAGGDPAENRVDAAGITLALKEALAASGIPAS